MAAMTEITCKCGCGRRKMVRVADRKRGWGLFYSKSCKARWQEKRTGQHRAYLRGEGVSHAAKRRGENPDIAIAAFCDDHNIDYPSKHDGFYDYDCDFPEGWDGHKGSW